MKKYLCIALPIFLLCQASYAMFCPTNFNLINMGDSIDTVKAQCGTPDEEKTSKDKPADTGPQTWTYYVQQSPRNPTSMRLDVVFDQEKVINISVNGAGISTTNLCGHTIKTADSMQTVKSACGSPKFTDKGQDYNASGQPLPTPTPVESTEFKYNSTTPPTTLIFKDGKLTSRTTS